MEYRELGHDVRRGAESVDPETARIGDRLPRTIADEAGAHQRGSLGVGVDARNLERIVSIGDRELRIAAVDGVAGELRPLAQVLAAPTAKAAAPASLAQPR